MEIIKPGSQIDFMKYRKYFMGTSIVLVTMSLIALFVPGPNFGIDFNGGTEIQLQFEGDITTTELRQTIEGLGYENPDVIAVTGRPNDFIIRMRAVSVLPEGIEDTITGEVQNAFEDAEVVAVRVSPGGDKVSVRLTGSVDETRLAEVLGAAGLDIRGEVRSFGAEDDHRYEADLVGVADRLIEQLREELGERGPNDPERIEWVGPRAGEQLRRSAVQALLYAIAMIMVYVAFRFDLRFAPGGVMALTHDALITVGFFVLVRKEFNLTTVASLLTIIGYSINDTIVVYDRIRENMGRYRDKTLADIINLSTSQMLGRTIVTSGTTLLSVSAFFIWGTSVIQDIAFALIIGISVGTYSSIYIAAPMTEWMDRQFFQRAAAAAAASNQRTRKKRK